MLGLRKVLIYVMCVAGSLSLGQAFAGVFIDNFDDPDQSEKNWEQPINATPKFIEGRYEMETEGNENSVSVLVEDIPIETEDGMVIEVVGEDMGDARANNFFICFAYITETEMYIAGPYVGGRQDWPIMQINPQARAFVQEFATTLDVLGPNIKYNVRVEIHGDTVELYGGEVGQVVEKKTEWTFDGGVPVGRIGLGGTDHRARFDNFRVSGPNVPDSAVDPGSKLTTTWGRLKAK